MKLKNFLSAEIFLMIGLFFIFITTLATINPFKHQSNQKSQAIEYMEQAKGAVLFIKEEDVNRLDLSGIYHPQVFEKKWILVEGDEKVNGFLRYINISEDSEINNKQITIVVSWGDKEKDKVETSFSLFN